MLPIEDGANCACGASYVWTPRKAALLDRLGFDLPRRLRVPPPVSRSVED